MNIVKSNTLVTFWRFHICTNEGYVVCLGFLFVCLKIQQLYQVDIKRHRAKQVFQKTYQSIKIKNKVLVLGIQSNVALPYFDSKS